MASSRVGSRILENLDGIEAFEGFGSAMVPRSIKTEFGEGVRKVVVDPLASLLLVYLGSRKDAD